MAELASHQLNAANWFLGSAPAAVTASGGVHRFKDGREVYDHIYSMWEYPGGRTATYSSVESNAFENRYEVYFGTKATLLVRNENEALLLEEGSAANRQTTVQVTPRDSGPAADASETRPGNTSAASAAAATPSAPAAGPGRPAATRQQISRFCSAVRVGTPVACGAEAAMHSARACIRANEAIQKQARLAV